MTKKIIILLIAVIGLTGCFRSGSKHSIRDYYLLEVARSEPASSKSFDKSLIVSKFDVAAGFDNSSLMYRNDKGKFETDYYRRFISGKGQMLNSITTNWFADSGLFKFAAQSGAGIAGDYVMRGLVEQMYADMQVLEEAKAVLVVKVFVSDFSGNVVFFNRYTTTAPIPAATADAVVIATNHTIEDFLTQLEADLAKEQL